MSCRPLPPFHELHCTRRGHHHTVDFSPQPQRGTEALAATCGTQGGTRGNSRRGLRHRHAR